MSAGVRGELAEIGRKLDALGIIVAAPLWPMRDRLSHSGQTVFDTLTERAKSYALAVVDEDFVDALSILAGWSALISQFVDATLILDDDPEIAEANERLLAVFLYYCRACGVEFSAIEKQA